METINTILKYIGYIAVSFALGWCSAHGEIDFIHQIQGSIIAILLTLTVLNTTLTNLLLNELLKFRDRQNTQANIGKVLKQMKRSSAIEISLIAISIIAIILGEWGFSLWQDFKDIGTIIIDSLLIFDIGYFLLVIFDDVEGWYKLLKENNS